MIFSKNFLSIKSYKAVPLILTKGDVGLGEAYAKKYIYTEDLSKLLIYILKLNIKKGLLKKQFALLHKLTRKNNVLQAKRNIAKHYDLGNEFFFEWLDNSFSYSSGIFENYCSLEQAQINKYKRIVEKLNLTDQNIIEIGCGWGGFIKYILDNTNCTVTGLTISKEQYLHCKELFRGENRIKILQVDYRDYIVSQKFDAAVSIEMIEAVGYEYWDIYFDVIKKMLKPQGLFLLQAICLNTKNFDNYLKNTDFIRTHIFPGGCLLELNFLRKQMDLIEEYEFSSSYVDTLQNWLERFLSKKDLFFKMGYDEEFLRLWEFYLNYAIATFKCKKTSVRQFIYLNH